MLCEPNSLASSARCFSCLPLATLSSVETYLLCQIANGHSNFDWSTLAYYWPLGENAGETRADIKDSKPLSELVTVGSAAGKRGNAASLTGRPTGRLRTASFTLAAPFSICFWAYVSATSAGITVLAKYGSAPSSGIWFNGGADPAGFACWVGTDGDNFGMFAANIPLNTWAFVAVTVDAGAQGVFYVNSIHEDDGMLDPVTTDGPLTIGNNSDDPNFPNSAFDGRVDELMIFTSVLTQAQITSLYNGGAGKFYGP